MKRALEIDIDEETIRQVTEKIGAQVFEEDSKRAQKILDNLHKIDILEEKDKKEKILYIMMDGAAVNTRIEDPNGSTWRENKTVMAFTDKDMIKRKDGSNIIVTKEYAAYIGSAENFRKYVIDLAVRAGYGEIKTVVIIGDGAAWIRNLCQDLFPDSLQILDLYHLKENIYNYAKYKCNQKPDQYTPFAEDLISKMEKGQTEEVLTQLPQEETLPTGVVNLRTYIGNNKDKVDYPKYKRQGYFIGSGAIESANKLILHRRLKQPGMRWSVDGGQSVLTLRAKYESGLWANVEEVVMAMAS